VVIAASALLAVTYGARVWKSWGSIPVADPQAIKPAFAEIADRPLMVPGSRLIAPGLTPAGSAYSLVVIVSPSCRFCVASVPFYRRLMGEAARGRLPLWISAPATPASSGILSALGIKRDAAVPWGAFNEQAGSTPTILLWGPGGVIEKTWVGELTPEKESEVLAAVRAPASVHREARSLPAGEIVMTASEASALAGAMLIDVSERDRYRKAHAPGAINVPFKELFLRANRDIRRDRLNVLDCSNLDDLVCAQALLDLRQDGFRVAAADLTLAEPGHNGGVQ